MHESHDHQALPPSSDHEGWRGHWPRDTGRSRAPSARAQAIRDRSVDQLRQRLIRSALR